MRGSIPPDGTDVDHSIAEFHKCPSELTQHPRDNPTIRRQTFALEYLYLQDGEGQISERSDICPRRGIE